MQYTWMDDTRGKKAAWTRRVAGGSRPAADVRQIKSTKFLGQPQMGSIVGGGLTPLFHSGAGGEGGHLLTHLMRGNILPPKAGKPSNPDNIEPRHAKSDAERAERRYPFKLFEHKSDIRDGLDGGRSMSMGCWEIVLL